MIASVGLIGDPVKHSVSPAFQTAAFRHHGLPDTYMLWPTSTQELTTRVAGLRADGMRGANVTLPYKTAVVPLLDELDGIATAVSAVNTIVRRADGSLYGLNTDVLGFIQALRAAGGEPREADCVLLGAGGSARAVAYGLVMAGARSITVVNRTPERAEAMLADVLAATEFDPQLQVLASDAPEVAQAVAGAQLLINATSVGLDGRSSPLEAERIAPHLLVVDLIYRNTPFLQAARQRGARTQNGLEMLVQQGALAFEAWTGLTAPIAVMRAAAQQALEEQT
ncbi:MAG: shikimate dehydrogenase [Chloroflexota bacterium]|nr:shikimate dehydrogenase [Chloroflexota bacterium]PLS78495.1 MAG: shikimate dehydrogenase [Chloroflexota bacterium]